MTDEHAKLTAEYEWVLRDLANGSILNREPVLIRAVEHILKRLGPPSADDAVDGDELKAALEAQTSGGA